MKYLHFSLCLLLFFLGRMSGVAQDIKTYTIQVIGQEDRLPIPGATITMADGGRYVTNTQGESRIKTRKKNISIKVTAIGYADFEQEDYPLSSSSNNLIYLVEGDISLNAVEVVKQRSYTSLVQQSSSIEMDQLLAKSGNPLAKLLEEIPGVSSISTGATISKPVIQGMHSNRILLINNGVKLESQGWGADHAPEIDHTGAAIVEVIKGAEAIRYGSGALGGVVLFNPSALPFNKKNWHTSGTLNTGYATNGRRRDVAASVELGKGVWATRLHVQTKGSGDYSTAHYLLNNTGTREQSWSAYTGFKKDQLQATVYYSYFANKSGIFFGSHLGGLEDLLARFEYGRPYEVTIQPYSYKIKNPCQQAKHHLLKGEFLWDIGEKNKIDFKVAYQRNHREEYENRRDENFDKIPVMNLILQSFNSDLLYKHLWDQRGWETQIGSSGLFQTNKNQPGTSATPFIPNYTTLSIGGYAIQKMALDALTLEGGLRYDWRVTSAAGYNWRRELYGGRRIYSNLTGSLAAFYAVNDNLSLRANVGLAWRAPDVNELYSNGLHHGGSWSVGNDKLKSERGYKAVIGAKWHNEFFLVEPGVFYQSVHNYIYDSPDKSLGYNGIHVHWNGAYPIFAFNQDNCNFWGGDLSLRTIPLNGLDIYGKGEWIRAKNTTRNTWLPYIPSDRYTLGIEYQYQWGGRDQWQLGLSSEGMYVTKQTRFDPEKDLVPSTPPAYGLINAQAEVAYRLAGGIALRAIVSGENLLNKEYKEYTDRFRYYAHAPGRNITCRFIINF